MPATNLSAIAKWPNVPACYGWLSLDRRGRWRLQGEPVTHAGLIAFINRQYGSDEAGRWYLQNGPQRVFAALDYTPWVLRRETDGSFTTHTGAPAGATTAAFLDDAGSVLLHCSVGIGLLDDRDLPAFFEDCLKPDGTAADEAALIEVMAGGGGVFWNELALQPIHRTNVATYFNFQPEPTP